MVNVSEALVIYKILEYSCFDESEQWTIIVADGFESYADILTLGDVDIVNLVKGFSDRTVSQKWLPIGTNNSRESVCHHH